MSLPTLAPIEALHSCVDGRYDDARVSVRWEPHGTGPVVEARSEGTRLVVTHRVRPADLDDEIGGPLARALAPLTDDHDLFARAFTGVVLSTDHYAPAAWSRFYRNTLELLDRPVPPGYSGVYRHALDLLPVTSVVDLGCSFGFLSLHLAARGTTAMACDVDPGTTALLRCMSRRLRRVVDVHEDVTLIGDGAADGVALLHVLEHVDDATGRQLLAHAMRIARRRVVVAVPFEAAPDALFGHVRSLDLGDLYELGAASGWAYSAHEHLGGWLVLDRAAGHHGGQRVRHRQRLLAELCRARARHPAQLDPRERYRTPILLAT